MGMRSLAQDLRYLLSKDNTKSRGFYWGITVAFALLLLISVVLFVTSLIGVTSGSWRIMGFAMLPVVILLLVACVWVLDRNS